MEHISAPLGRVIQKLSDKLYGPSIDWRAKAAEWGEEWAVEWSERAAILEYEAGNSRDDAERMAFVQIAKARRP